MYYVNREALDAVEQALERIHGESHLNETAIAQLAGLPATEVRAALHAIAERRAWATRSDRTSVDSGGAVSMFLKEYELLLFPFI
jgi:hypothetical protein